MIYGIISKDFFLLLTHGLLVIIIYLYCHYKSLNFNVLFCDNKIWKIILFCCGCLIVCFFSFRENVFRFGFGIVFILSVILLLYHPLLRTVLYILLIG